MIVTIQGAKRRGRSVGAITVLTAATEAFKTNGKVLIMSLRDYQEGNNIEDYAIPKDEGFTDQGGLLRVSGYTFSDTGIDAAIRRADTGKFTAEQLDVCVTPTVRAKNGLDILRNTKEATFEKSALARFESIKTVIEMANTIYDYVFVYVPVTYNKFIEKMNELSDKIVVVVKQGAKEDFAEANSRYLDKIRLLVTDFEEESLWNEKKIRTMYDVKTLYKMPHNVRFRDAKEDGELIKFAMQNNNPDKTDYNYALFNEMYKLLDFIDDKKESTLYSFDDEIIRVRAKKPRPALRIYEPARSEVVTEKKWFGLKADTYKKAVFTETPIYSIEDKGKTAPVSDEKTALYQNEYEEAQEIEMNMDESDDIQYENENIEVEGTESYKDNYDRSVNAPETEDNNAYSWLNDDFDDEEAATAESEEETNGWTAPESFLEESKKAISQTEPAEETALIENEAEEAGTDDDEMKEVVAEDAGCKPELVETTDDVDYEPAPVNIMDFNLKKPVKKEYPERPKIRSIEKPDTQALDERISEIEREKNQITDEKAALDEQSRKLLPEVTNGSIEAMSQMQDLLNKVKEYTERMQALEKELSDVNDKKETLISEYNAKVEAQESIKRAYDDACRSVDRENELAMEEYNRKCQELKQKLENLKEPEYPKEPAYDMPGELDFTGVDKEISDLKNKAAELLAKKEELDAESKELLAKVSSGDMEAMTKMQSTLTEIKNITIEVENIKNEVVNCDTKKEKMKSDYDRKIEQIKIAKAEYRKQVLALKREYEDRRKALIAEYAS